MKNKLTTLNKVLIAGNVLFFALGIAAAMYETPRHKREDALNALMSIERSESLPDRYFVRQYIQDSISKELGRQIKVNWAGIEWARVTAMLRTHATTTEGERYVVQMLLEPTEEQAVERVRTEVIVVSDQVMDMRL